MSGYGVHPELITPSLFDDIVLHEWTTKYNYDHSVYPQGHRTSKYGYSVYPEGTTRYNINNSVFPKANRSSKNPNGVYPEWTTEYLYDYRVTTDLGEKIRHASSFEYDQDAKEFLQECPNGPVLQKLLCYPSLEYNIKNRTPVTILLSFLAGSDVTAVVLMTIPVFISPVARWSTSTGPAIILFDFPECLIEHFFDQLKLLSYQTSTRGRNLRSNYDHNYMTRLST
ncbi:unnamed protein product [Mytilus edulis]|uniref:Uncharacterized protein n=1 Tax=Mytilus edulis TaxID=6550 RepID=A0A8S3VAV6_MYTED|nr:unnamed protein product [Mytilus edulis]